MEIENIIELRKIIVSCIQSGSSLTTYKWKPVFWNILHSNASKQIY